jgi:deoxyribodipyrimidine photo-lyase
MKYGIHWFRRDLRLRDNLTLHALSKQVDAFVPVFIIDPRLVADHKRGSPRTSFLFDCLEHLEKDLARKGHSLLLRVGKPECVIPDLMREAGASVLSFGKGVTPFAIKRDAAIRTAVESLGAEVIECNDDMIMKPEQVTTQKGQPFRVYSPFRKAWWDRWNEEPVRGERRLRLPMRIPGSKMARNSVAQHATQGSNGILLPSGGEAAARRRLSVFLAGPIGRYPTDRERPDVDGTSRLSPYLRFGVISPRICFNAALKAGAQDAELGPGVDKWLDELIWREFYNHLASADPSVLQGNARSEYDNMKWNDDPVAFSAWANGQTGYPIVDAGMRQLRKTGWMHNRVRMVVASFLTKDLLIDWRKGERLFMDLLVDGDPTSNNGGWQWCASTGSDAQPYFRIFNPTSQGTSHDPQGRYVRKWVPELRDVPTQYIHSPWKMTVRPVNYPAPIVDHAVQRKLALERYKQARSFDQSDLRKARSLAES